MSKSEKKEQRSLPPCPNPLCSQSCVVRNGSHPRTAALLLPHLQDVLWGNARHANV